jgi:hypothetical protein
VLRAGTEAGGSGGVNATALAAALAAGNGR